MRSPPSISLPPHSGKKMNEDNNLIRVKDLYLAAALLSYGLEMSDIDRTDRRKQFFMFRDCKIPVFRNKAGIVGTEEANIDEITILFLSKSLYLPPTYPEAVKNIKAIIHST